MKYINGLWKCSLIPYDWVMVPNVYGMSQFADGGMMSTKPYISSSNYILKMSDYKKEIGVKYGILYFGILWTSKEIFLIKIQE